MVQLPLPAQPVIDRADIGRRELSALRHGCWPGLPEHIKQAVLALVRSTSDKEPTLWVGSNGESSRPKSGWA
jgi:hypothetical protein